MGEGSNDPFTGVTYQISCVSDIISITIAKLQLWSSSENHFMVGYHHNLRNCTLCLHTCEACVNDQSGQTKSILLKCARSQYCDIFWTFNILDGQSATIVFIKDSDHVSLLGQ